MLNINCFYFLFLIKNSGSNNKRRVDIDQSNVLTSGRNRNKVSQEAQIGASNLNRAPPALPITDINKSTNLSTKPPKNPSNSKLHRGVAKPNDKSNKQYPKQTNESVELISSPPLSSSYLVYSSAPASAPLSKQSKSETAVNFKVPGNMVSMDHVKEFQTIFGDRTSENETIKSLMTTIQGQLTNAHDRDKFHHDENTKRISSNSMSPFENANIMRANNMMSTTSEVSYYNNMMYTTSKIPSHMMMHTPTNYMMPITSTVPSHMMMHTPNNNMMPTTSTVPSHMMMHTPTNNMMHTPINNMMPTTSAVPAQMMMHTPSNNMMHTTLTGEVPMTYTSQGVPMMMPTSYEAPMMMYGAATPGAPINYNYSNYTPTTSENSSNK